MSDLADYASEAEELFRQHSLAERAAHRLEGAAAARCADCGEEIPRERRRAAPGATRCVECQAWAERVARAEMNNKNKGTP